jgi:hypothetical protein
MKNGALTASLFALAALAGCRSPSAALRGLAQDQHDDVIEAPHTGEEVVALQQRTLERADKTKALLGQKGVDSAADHYYAALVFVQCTREVELELAHQQGLVAAERGETRGFRVAAEAFDKLLLKRGMLQRYGTQFVWEPVLRSWRLYPIDPRTTDAERKAMGVPPLAELEQQAAELNKKKKPGADPRE